MTKSIIEFFKNQNIFITGGSGFLGRVLVEKILRASPDVNNIYLLLRKKKNKDLKERFEDILKSPLFDILKKKYPENLHKIILVNGDCNEIGLGLSESDRQILEENVSIVFHCAASVRFDEPLKYAVLNNTRGTREVMMLSQKMKNLKALVHVSTSYCNCDKSVVEERLYPAPTDWRKFIEIAENTDEHLLDILTAKIIDKLPNTYLFSKALAEHVVKDLGENLPVVIIRPSIVTCVWKDPIPGWTDNFNGPVGLLIGGGKGVVRSAISKLADDSILDCVPVDTVIKVICIAAWVRSNSGKMEEPSVYNVTALDHLKFSLPNLIRQALDVVHAMPMRGAFWVPRVFITESRILFYLHSFFLQLIPAIIVDFFIKLCGKKPLLAKIQRKIFITFMALAYFTLNSWTFKTDKMVSLKKQVPSTDEPFSLKEFDEFEMLDYFLASFSAAFRFIVKIPVYDTKGRRELKWMKRIENFVILSTIIFVVLWIYEKTSLFSLNDAFSN